MTFNGIQTIYSIMLMNRMLVDADYNPPINTTLNEKFDILRNTRNKKERYPVINLLTIGSGNTLDISRTKYRLENSGHSPIDAALFNHVPFYLRKLSEVKQYPIPDYLRLRTILTIDDEEYLAAYGMVLHDKIIKDDVILLKNVTDEYARIYNYDFNVRDPLNPKPNENLDMRNTPKNFIGDLIKYYVFLDNIDLEEIKHAMDILGIENYKINEMGVCFSKGAINRIKRDDFGIDIRYTESIETQIAYFLDCDIDLNVDVLDFYIEIGGMQLLGEYK